MTLPRTQISASVADLGPDVTLDITGIPPDVIAKVEAAQRKHIISDRYPYRMKMRRKVYESEKALLQTELLKVQQWLREAGERIVLIFEGRDAAGKGGTIKRFMEHLNPRGAQVIALEKPSERERTQWYFQRYIEHLPSAGEIVLFDRSWYNRAGVERVMGFCSPNEYLEFMRQCPEIERMMVRSGVSLTARRTSLWGQAGGSSWAAGPPGRRPPSLGG